MYLPRGFPDGRILADTGVPASESVSRNVFVSFRHAVLKLPSHPAIRILAFSSPVALTFILRRFPLSLIPIHIFRTIPTARRELGAPFHAPWS